MDAKYPSDAQGRRGLAAYVAHAKELLAESAADKNPFEGYAVEVPEGERMAIGSDAFREDERRGPNPSPSPSPNPRLPATSTKTVSCATAMPRRSSSRKASEPIAMRSPSGT